MGTIDSQSKNSTANSDTASNDLFAGMQPAFKHEITGEAHLAQSSPGIPSSAYAFIGLPDEWIAERDDCGQAIALHPEILPGYWRDAQFIGLRELPSLPLDG
ncbi:MAG: hypothetical protein AB8B84_11115 [Granulosicoccus sp.]